MTPIESTLTMIDRKHAHERYEGSLAHIALFLRATGNGNGSLDADEHPDGHHHGAAHLIEERHARHGTRREVLHEYRRIELLQKDDGRDSHEDRHEFRNGDNGVDACGFLDAARYEEYVKPDENASADNRWQVRPAAEYREEVGKSPEQKRREAHRAQKRADPIAPCAVEPEKIAESGIRITVDAAFEFGFHAGKGEKRHNKAQHAHRRNAPRRQNGRAACTARSLIPRQRENAAADDQRDNRSNQTKDPEASAR